MARQCKTRRRRRILGSNSGPVASRAGGALPGLLGTYNALQEGWDQRGLK